MTKYSKVILMGQVKNKTYHNYELSTDATLQSTYYLVGLITHLLPYFFFV